MTRIGAVPHLLIWNALRMLTQRVQQGLAEHSARPVDLLCSAAAWFRACGPHVASIAMADTKQANSDGKYASVDIAWNNLHVQVPSKTDGKVIEILKGVSGYAKRGCVTSIMGPSGAGKTTMVRARRTCAGGVAPRAVHAPCSARAAPLVSVT